MACSCSFAAPRAPWLVGLTAWVLIVIGLLPPAAGADSSPVGALASSPTGAWYPTGSMVHSRISATATLLRSGKVLVVGGGTGWTAELYDPLTGTWTSAEAPSIRRPRHTATLLPDGRVLVVGGRSPVAELYDPGTGTWSSAASLQTPRMSHTATLLPSGRVLVVGGFDRSNILISRSEVYDPSSDSWSVVGQMTTLRYGHTATLLSSGMVLIVGGFGEAKASAELFDPVGQVFVATASPAIGRAEHTATLLPSGEVLITGGSAGGLAVVASAERFDPVQQVWSTAGTQLLGREDHRATLLPSGKVMITGGRLGGPFSMTDRVEMYDPSAPPSSAWSEIATLQESREGHIAMVLPSGSVLVAGGFRATAELYLPTSGRWHAAGELAEWRTRPTLTVLASGAVLVVGGESDAPGTAELYDPVRGTWSVAGSPETGRTEHTATLLHSGEVLVVGGSNGEALASAELYDPESDTWRLAGTLEARRLAHTATRLASGRVLIVGGTEDPLESARTLASVELYDPETETWSVSRSMAVPRARHTATLLPSGKVLVTGGQAEGPLSSAELYDPKTESWSSIAQLPAARRGHTATLLPSGEVLVLGGGRAGAERFDPSTGRWTATGDFLTARSDYTVTLLESGHVLAVGGHSMTHDATSELEASSEIYVPALGIWTPTDPLSIPRGIHSAVLLPSGEVLVVGGGVFSWPSAEIFDPSTAPAAERQPVVQRAHGPIAFDRLQTLPFVIEGRFRGDSEGHGGCSSCTPSNVPIVHLRSIDGSVYRQLEPDEIPSVGPPPWDGNIWDEPMTLTFGSLPPTLPPGQYLLTVVTAGVPSEPVLTEVTCSVGFGLLDDQLVERLDSTTFEVDVPGAVSYQWETCHGDPASTCRPPADPLDSADSGGPGWRAILGATGPSLDVGPIQGVESGSLYRVLARGFCAQRRSEPAALIVDDATPPGATDGLPPVAVVAPRGGELWPLSRDGEPSVRDIVWTMSDDVRICRVDVDLLHSEDGGQTFPGSLRVESFGSAAGCYAPGELNTRLTYAIPAARPIGGAGSLYKARITVTDHAGNATQAESDRPFYLVEPNNDSVETLILWHPERMEDLGMPTDDLATALANFADHPAVRGRVVDLGLSDALRELYRAWDRQEIEANKLLFAEDGLRDYLHASWLASFPAIESIVLVGDDRLMPFARLPDGTAAATVAVSEAAYPSDPTMDPDVDLTPDGTRVAQALATDHYLSDDPLVTRGTIRPNDLDDTIFLPDLGVGRLVETPSEIIASIAGFLSSEGVVDLTRRSNPVFVSAYDFLVDAGTRIEDRWQSVLGDEATEALLGQTWTSSDLTASLCVQDGYGIVSLNGHATHYQVGHPSAGGPFVIDGTPTTDLVGCDLAGSLIYAIGCHSGLPVSDDSVEPEHDHPYDLPQAMLGTGALAFLGNTGYGWGLKHGVGYSERLVEIFTQELSAVDGVTIGDAVRRTKTRYYLESPYFDSYDEKVSMQWTLYGFPMLRLRTGTSLDGAARPFAAPPLRPEAVPRRLQLGAVTVERRVVGTTVVDGVEVVPPAHLSREPRSFDFRGDRVYKVFNAAGEEVGPSGASADHCDRTRPDPDPDDGIPQGCYVTLNGLSNGQDIHSGAADRPLEPLFISDIGLSGTRFHGFLWLGGTYVEQRDWVPLFAELQSNIDGGFSDRGALPSNSRSNGRGRIRHGGVLGDTCAPSDLDRTSLVLEAGEVLRDTGGVFSIQRRYETIDTELFYYNNPDDPAQRCDITGPQVIAEHTVSGSTIAWRVQAHADEIDPIWRVVVAWTDNTVDPEGRGRWQPLELESVDGVFEGSIDVFGSTRVTYFVQALDERGNVSVVSAGDPGAASGVTHEVPALVEVDLVAGEADLGVVLSTTPNPLPALATLSLVVAVTNHGPDAASGVSATIELPAALRRVGHGGAGWSCALDASTLQCARDVPLAVRETAPIYIFGKARSKESIDLGATVGSRSVDRMPENDRASLTIAVVSASER